MRYHEATMAGRRRMILLGTFLASLGLALADPPESRAQYWQWNKTLPYRGNAAPGSIQRLRDIDTLQPSPPPRPSSINTPDNDLAFYPSQFYSSNRSYYSGEEPARPLPPPARPLPYGIAAADLPWNQGSFDDYNEAPQMPEEASPREPKKYLLAVKDLPPASPREQPFAVLIAHLPNHAVFWVDQARTRSMGRTRYFQSPPLSPDRKYTYQVRAAWLEDGRWVSQTSPVPVEAGLIQAIYLRPAPSASPKAAMKSLSK